MAFGLYNASLREKALQEEKNTQLATIKYQTSRDLALMDYNTKMGQIEANTALKLNKIQGKYQMYSTAINAAANIGIAAMQNYYQLKVQENNFQLKALELKSNLAAQTMQLDFLKSENTRKQVAFDQGQADRALSALMIPKIALFQQVASSHAPAETVDAAYTKLLADFDTEQNNVYRQYGANGILSGAAATMFDNAGKVLQGNMISTDFGNYRISEAKSILESFANPGTSGLQDPKLVMHLAEKMQYNPQVDANTRMLASSAMTKLIAQGPDAYAGDIPKLMNYISVITPMAALSDKEQTDFVLATVNSSSGATLLDKAKALQEIVTGAPLDSVKTGGSLTGLSGITDTTGLKSALDIMAPAEAKNMAHQFPEAIGPGIINDFVNGKTQSPILGMNIKYTPGSTTTNNGALNLKSLLDADMDASTFGVSEGARLAVITQSLRDYLVDLNSKRTLTSEEVVKAKDALDMLEAVPFVESELAQSERGFKFGMGSEAIFKRGTTIYRELIPDDRWLSLLKRSLIMKSQVANKFSPSRLNFGAAGTSGTPASMPGTPAATSFIGAEPKTTETKK